MHDNSISGEEGGVYKTTLYCQYLKKTRDNHISECFCRFTFSLNPETVPQTYILFLNCTPEALVLSFFINAIMQLSIHS